MLAAMLDWTVRSATRPAAGPSVAGCSADRLRVSSTQASPAGWLVVVAGLAGLTGCSGIEPVAPYQNLITDPTQIYTRLTLDYRVLTLSTDPGCHCATWQLTAPPRDARGSVMDGLPAPTFSPLSTADTTTVQVTADGLVTALQPGTTKVLVELAVGGVRHADTAFIQVQNPVPLPTLASVSIDPLPPDSAIRGQPFLLPPNPPGVDGNRNPIGFVPSLLGFLGDAGMGGIGHNFNNEYRLTPLALNTSGESVTDLAFDFESLDPAIATVIPAADRRSAEWVPKRPGQARLVVRTTAYGVTVASTTVFTVTVPVAAVVQAQRQSGAPSTTVFEPYEVHIRPNGMVFWGNVSDHAIDVTFDDPTNVVEAPAPLCTVMDINAVVFGPAPNCATGNFTLALPPPAPDFPSYDALEVRGFPAAGVYTYHASTGATGRVVVE